MFQSIFTFITNKVFIHHFQILRCKIKGRFVVLRSVFLLFVVFVSISSSCRKSFLKSLLLLYKCVDFSLSRATTLLKKNSFDKDSLTVVKKKEK